MIRNMKTDKEKQEKPVEKSKPQETESKHNNQLFTEDELQKAWQLFAENLNEEKLLKNTARNQI